MKPLYLLQLLPLIVLAACTTVGPDYESPAAPEAGDWAPPVVGEPMEPEALEAEMLGRWWERFGDPQLDRLVEAALAGNPTVHEAAARIAEVRILRDRTAGGTATLGRASGDVTERRQSENGPLPIDRIPGLDRDQTLVNLGFDASWELDLFGRKQRAVEAAEARLESAREDLAGARLSVVAEVARTYFALRGGQRRLAALEAMVDSVRTTRALVEQRVEAGAAAPLELDRIDAELIVLEARLPRLRGEARVLALALGTLVGVSPESELGLLEESPPTFEPSPFPIGHRAEMLRRRPDVRVAERRLAAASAEIGVATAELYPRLSIGASGGFQALDGEDLLSSSSATWSLVPRISWRLFDGGRVRAEIRLAEARAHTAAVRWEGAVLEALSDAERALARYRAGLEQLALERRAVAAAERTRALERQRYEAGESGLLPVLDAERRLDEIEAGLAETEIQVSTEMVALIKALGGGWEVVEDEGIELAAKFP